MSIEIVAIGNELLSGLTVNTNASWISEKLSGRWDVGRHTVIPDDPQIIASVLGEALQRSSVVIATGGLGPTVDDVTFPAAKSLFEEIPQEIPNKVGSAPGYVFTAPSKILILLPGIPLEMHAMFEASVVPFLETRVEKTKAFHELMHLCLLKEMEVDPFLRTLKVDCGIYPSYGTLTLRLSSSNKNDLAVAKKQVQEKFGRYLFSEKSVTEALHVWMIAHEKTLALAESCTGGFMAADITAHAGASNYFLGSAVVYSNALKEKILGVSPMTLHEKGAVSQEVVQEMLQGIFKITTADFGIAVSGIAGPSGGTPGKPVGTICYALGARGKTPQIGTFHVFSDVRYKGNREAIISLTGRRLFGLLWIYINNK